MRILQGKGVYGAVKSGTISVYKRCQPRVAKKFTPDTDGELLRFESAKDSALTEIRTLYERTLSEIGEENADIFRIHMTLLSDPDYNAAVNGIIRQERVNAEYAVAATAHELAKKFSHIKQDYMKERYADVADVSDRILRFLVSGSEEKLPSSQNMILYTDELVPSEILEIDRAKVNAFVTAFGSTASHAAILARNMGLPAVVGTGTLNEDEINGHFAIVDGFTGTVYIDPDEKTIAAMDRKKNAEAAKKAQLGALSGAENITLCGKKIELLANICSPEEIALVLENDAGGIGLFRSEFLYIQHHGYPDEEVQFHIYRRVLEAMEGRRVIIRTFDLGGDKNIPGLGGVKEENPALGCRAIRLCLAMPKLFQIQLRALCRASVYGNLSVIFPMVVCVEEVRRAKALLREVMDELRTQGIPFNENLPVGLMLETPAALMISDILAKEADFFSIGTNDLTQYTLAADRHNPAVSDIYDTRHTAIIRMMKFAISALHRAGKPVHLCGEIAADTSLTATFLALGVDGLSVPPDMILPVRRAIRATNVEQIRPTVVKKYCIDSCLPE